MVGTKQCSNCNCNRPPYMYKPDHRTKDGLAKTCDICKAQKKKGGGG